MIIRNQMHTCIEGITHDSITRYRPGALLPLLDKRPSMTPGHNISPDSSPLSITTQPNWINLEVCRMERIGDNLIY